MVWFQVLVRSYTVLGHKVSFSKTLGLFFSNTELYTRHFNLQTKVKLDKWLRSLKPESVNCVHLMFSLFRVHSKDTYCAPYHFCFSNDSGRSGRTVCIIITYSNSQHPVHLTFWNTFGETQMRTDGSRVTSTVICRNRPVPFSLSLPSSCFRAAVTVSLCCLSWWNTPP